MSGKATGWVMEHGPERKGLRAVMLAIADVANVDGENARIDWRGIASRSARSRSAVAGALRELIAEGWVEVCNPGGGRGRVAVYRIPGMTEKGSGNEMLKGPVSDAKGSRNSTVKGPETGQNAQVIPLLPKTVKQTVEKGATPHSDDARRLCEQLADRVASLRHGARPAVTARWLKDMRLLIERGPLHRDSPEAHLPGKIAATIDFVFDEMAEPEGRGAFCWADQIRSPHALRDHWYQMARAAENKLRARRSSTAQAIDRMLPGAGSTPLPTHLLPGYGEQRKAIR